MEIHYRLTVEDFWQYHRYTLERAWRKLRWCWRWLPGIALAAVVPGVGGGYADTLSLMCGFGLGGLWVALIPWLGRRLARWRFLRNWPERDGLSGEHRLELAGDGLIETAGDRTVKAEWGLVRKVAVNGPRIYIYIEALRTVIVPLEVFRDIMHYNQFMARLAEGTGLPLDVLKISEDSPEPPQRRRSRVG